MYTYPGTDIPTMKLLNKHVNRVISPCWRDLGLQLLEEKYTPHLNIIEINNPKNVEVCCKKMFEHWLAVDEGACWNKLINALKEIGQNTLAANVKQNILKGNFIVYYYYHCSGICIDCYLLIIIMLHLSGIEIMVGHQIFSKQKCPMSRQFWFGWTQ